MARLWWIPSRAAALAAVSLVALPSPPARAQQTAAAVRLQWYERHVAMREQSLFENLPWQFLGPTNISGRMNDIAVVEPRGRSYTMYVAGATGGVWKTVNEGTTWEPVFEHAVSTSTGDVTIAPSNPDIVWVGTGEPSMYSGSIAGAGVYKSTDAGATWRHMGLAATHTIGRIVIHPSNPDIVYVAATGHGWTHNPERGVYRTLDGGATWDKVLYINEQTGAIDLVMDPSNPSTVYAATWQRIRWKWEHPINRSDYRGSGIYKTTDAGATWREITAGLPAPQHRGRIGLDIDRANPSVLYAFVDNYETAREAPPGERDVYGRPKGPVIKGATIFRTGDGGRSWRQVSEDGEYMERLPGTYGWIFGQIRVDPNDPSRIYVLGLRLNVSEDGGRTFRELPGMHGDHHGLWIDPDNSGYLVDVNDGGVVISYDAGATWKHFTHNIPIVQFYNVNFDMDEPFHVYGSVQDHGSRRGVVDLRLGRHNIPAVPWEDAPGGEAGHHAVDPTDPNVVYAEGFYGRIHRNHLETGEQVDIAPKPGDGEAPLRGQWVAPFIISPHNPRVIYHGMNKLFRSMDRGDRWEAISPDLTDNDPAEIGEFDYQTIYTISESPMAFGLLYVGTDDGHIWRTRDSGAHWSRIEQGVPPEKYISRIVASAYDEATVYMTQNGKRDDDFTPYVWKSVDYGDTWRSIVNNLPSGPVNVIREDPKNRDVLYVGTDLGVYVSLDGGRGWQVLANGLPPIPVMDLVIHPRDDIMVAATHGRGMFAMDVRPIQRMTPEILARELYLFDPEPVNLAAASGGRRPTAAVHYSLEAPATVTIQIREATGAVVAELAGTGSAGFNQAVWDLTRAGDRGGRRGPPLVPPGAYTVELTAGRRRAEGVIEVRRPSLRMP